MRRKMLKSKVHRATVTSTELHYEGSLTIDRDLLDAADILPFEQIHVWDVTNGTRLVTYALPGDRGSGVVQVNGGAAHLMKTGDVIIVATFTTLRTKEARKHEPTVVFVDESNRVRPPLASVVPMAPAAEVLAALEGTLDADGTEHPAADAPTLKPRKKKAKG